MGQREDIAFDQYQRYETIRRLIFYHRQSNLTKTFRVLELGANEHKDLALFLENDEIVFTDIQLSEKMRQDPAFQQVDGSELPFADGSFDFVVAADVLEHVPLEKRVKFFSEAYRVAKIGAILCFPRDSIDVIDVEIRVNAYYKAISGEDFIWLNEHRKNGLPRIDEVEALLQKQGYQHFSFSHGTLELWEKMWYCHFNVVFTPETLEYRGTIDRYYNRNLYANDVGERCYREFYVLTHESHKNWMQYAKNLWPSDNQQGIELLNMLLQAQREIHALYEEHRMRQAADNKEVRLHHLETVIAEEKIFLQQILEDKEKQIQCILSDKETYIHSLEEIIADNEKQIENKVNILKKLAKKYTTEKKLWVGSEQKLQNQILQVGQELALYQEHYHAAIGQREELKQQLLNVQNAYNIISSATCWKLTKPLRVILDVIKKLLKKSRHLCLFYKGIKCLKENGARYTWRKIQDQRKHRQDFSCVAKPLYTQEELEQQRGALFNQNIKFSILVPLFNTPEQFLHEMIRSVMDQTYANWELCLADGSDTAHAYVRKICMHYHKKDSRIIYNKLEQNLGISENTNACIELASGDYFALLDHDDLLHPAALYENMKAICSSIADMIYSDELVFEGKLANIVAAHFKPHFSPDTLRGCNYICHFLTFSRKLFNEVGSLFNSDCDGSQDYDMVLRLSEKAKDVVHIPKALYYWRASSTSVAHDISTKPYTIDAAKKALAQHLDRCGLDGVVEDADSLSAYRIQYKLLGNPLISIIIPNKDHIKELKKCIESIHDVSTYRNWELIVIENNSEDPATFAYYEKLQSANRARIITWTGPFNYAAINNFGVQHAKGDYFLLLNNDTEVITPDWLEQMLMFAQRRDVGAVGAMLYYENETIQHGGVILGIGGFAGHSHKGFPRGSGGYLFRLCTAQNLSAVTGACVMIRRDVWENVHGLDESFVVALNDVDFCMRVRQAGYLIVWTPFAELYHYESQSRGYEDTPEKQRRFEKEVLRFKTRWKKELESGDPYYNPNLTLEREDFSLK